VDDPIHPHSAPTSDPCLMSPLPPHMLALAVARDCQDVCAPWWSSPEVCMYTDTSATPPYKVEDIRGPDGHGHGVDPTRAAGPRIRADQVHQTWKATPTVRATVVHTRVRLDLAPVISNTCGSIEISTTTKSPATPPRYSSRCTATVIAATVHSRTHVRTCLCTRIIGATDGP
jgi:hypothetical protein